MARKVFFVMVILALASLTFGLALAQDDVPRGGTVRISEGQQSPWVRNFNPFAPDPTEPTIALIHEPLMILNPVDGGTATPWLATSYTYSDDLLSITYTLRDDVVFSDGEAFNADDVVFTFNMIQEFPALDRGGVWSFLSSVEKVDDFTVLFTLSNVYTQADTYISRTQIVPEHVWSQVEDPVLYTNDNPVATGPFTEIRNFSEQVILTCANPNYWGRDEAGNQLPYVECLEWPMYPGNDPANLALINGELDWVGNFVADIDATFVSKDPENNHYYFWPGGSTVQLYTNTTKAPFDDVQFRTALSQAIDYDSVVGIGMYGYTIPSNPVGLGPAHESWVSQEAIDAAADKGLGVYDPDAAAATLDEAGYVDADGDGWRDLTDGSPLAFKVQVVNGWTDWVTSVQIMSQNFQDIGLNASIETPDFGVWLNNLQTGTFDTSIGWSTAGRTPWDFYKNVLDSTLIGSDGLANGQLWGRWTSAEADELLTGFTATADAAAQQDIINQLQALYVENVVAVPLFPGPTWYEWVTTRFTGFPTVEDYYAQGSPWEAATGTRLLVVNRIHCIDDTACGQ